MTRNHEPESSARRREQRRLWVYGMLLFLVCVCLLLAKCAGKQADTRENEAAATACGRTGSTAGEPGEAGAAELPEGWTTLELGSDAVSDGTLVLVNREHGFDPSAVAAVSVWERKTGSYLVKDVYLGVDPTVAEQLNRWMDAFAEESGRRDVNIVAGYRSEEEQQALYENAVHNKGRDYADRYLALPGHSEHHTGLAVDLDTYDVVTGASGGFDGNGTYAWAVEHAPEFGFVQRYPDHKSEITGIDFEPWHFRYVGVPHAVYMSRNGLCLEEYIDLLREHPFSGEHLVVTAGGSSYEVYYCPGTRAVVPEQGTYTVSGNNVDGLIVTLQRGES